MARALILIFFTACACTNHRMTDASEVSTWNLLGGSHIKTGEMKSWNGYWIEAYIDTPTQNNKVLLVQNDPVKIITDSIFIGAFLDNMVLDYGTLRISDKWDPEIVAVFDERDSLRANQVVKAWRGNSETGKFESIPTAGITRGIARE